MTLPLPVAFNPELRADRLAVVAQWLLEELYATEEDLSRDSDDGYTRGCAIFGRQKNRVKIQALSGKHDWLSLLNGGNDLVFTIGGVPCRFCNDDPDNPTKDAVITTNRYQLPFFEFVEAGEPGKFCFIIDRGLNNLEDPCVEFLGFSPSGEIVCRWASDTVRIMRDANAGLALPAPIAKPVVTPKQDEDGNAATKAGA